jgi:hypothetical protein
VILPGFVAPHVSVVESTLHVRGGVEPQLRVGAGKVGTVSEHVQATGQKCISPLDAVGQILQVLFVGAEHVEATPPTIAQVPAAVLEQAAAFRVPPGPRQF